MKSPLPLFALLLSTSVGVRADAGGPPNIDPPPISDNGTFSTTVHAGSVSIEAGNLFIVGPWRPSSLLAAALVKYPKAHNFTVSWDSNGPGSTDGCLASYDRRSHSFQLSRSTFDAQINDDTKVETDFKSEEAWRYTHVTDAILTKLAKKNAHNYDGDDATPGYFTQLPKFGGKGRKIQNSHHTTHKKIPG